MRLAGTTVAILALAIFHHTAPVLITFTSEQTTLIDADIQGHPELDFSYDVPSRTSCNRKFRRGAVIRKCKVQPEDASWPAASKLQLLEGVVTPGSFSKPPPAVCYVGDFYNEAECARVVGSWYSSDFHATSGACTQGTYPVYVVSARTACNVQTSVNLLRNPSLRLVVKNTGHDFAGKSSGKGALSVRTHLLNEMAFIEEYDEGGEGGYSGPAFKVRARCRGGMFVLLLKDLGMRLLGEKGRILVIGADLVLSLDVVIANGRFVTASKDTFAIVTSISVKAHPDLPITTSQSIFTASTRHMAAISTGDLNRRDFWEVVKAYFRIFPLHRDLGFYSYWNMVVQPDSGIHFIMAPFFTPRFSAEQVNSLLSPLKSKASEFNIHLEPVTTEFTNSHDA
ncbi:hypothetical protein L873DRAFT_1844272 [Choiromyces venosus 120613-1]|uniref:FAD linked oxidase N-terminal domain-containing protein n=1 Tax=Choiromyces venosus 120613-1 TaxID=1336337 RepID=A0A3N4JN42_9PEZI|nr:hypothetical protein L873DRAFT_1844272 [Choiromyces venosus 120613-1]